MDDPLADGLALHRRALRRGFARRHGPATGTASTRSVRTVATWLRWSLSARSEVAGLPATEAVLPLLQRAAKRCGEGQSHTHAAGADGRR